MQPQGFETPHVAVDVTPLLENGNDGDVAMEVGSLVAASAGVRQQGGIQGAVQYIRRVSSGGSMSEPSMLVRETATEQLHGRQNEWAYSKPVVILDFIWNMSFVAVANMVMILTRKEQPKTPLRFWLLGYCLQCILHTVCVCCEYHRRRWQRIHALHAVSASHTSMNFSDHATLNFNNHAVLESNSQDVDAAEQRHHSLAKRLESANTIFSFLWWIVGYYWTTSVADTLSHESPGLYWLCLIFLAFDVFFVVFCVALACIIGIAICCCLPCLIAVLYAVTDQDGASDEDINLLPKHKFQGSGFTEKSSSLGGIMDKRTLSAEDAECCICLANYDDGVELRELPCSHHFHCLCIDKWLRINATCPLCKYNIIYNNRTEEV
ncbi:hypothetical protein O6H91_17G002100 [Diphasiastrum complanatum]|uniref:Uncharacterized protein n=2 Tax=Diphasiastrum complanatum TaxID=34168 RepID=A0ACC2B3R2_DIPCM|nr:hypothetical protein O6H91_17G000300 [Diphasiastrum complanatum]KAJ7524375.1 hypothetical protein O6H91_17G002100 [Diphasiastrum complanatum]